MEDETIPVSVRDLCTITNALSPLPDHVKGGERLLLLVALKHIGDSLNNLN